MLKPDSQAPDFETTNQHGARVSLAAFRGSRNVLLYFYPKDDTPGCTIEANDFSSLSSQFEALDTVILGVSRDSCESHRAFIAKFSLGVDLLADTSGELCQRYGVWQEKEKNGEKKMGIVRSTFLIDKQGRLVEALYGVGAEGHAAAMLERAKQL